MKKSLQNVFEERIEKLKQKNRKLKEKLDTLTHEKQALQNELGDVRQLLNGSSSAILLVQDERVVIANETTWRQLGYTEQEMVNFDFSSLVHPKSSDLFDTIRRNWVRGKPIPDCFEVYMRRKDGRPLCCEVSWRKIKFHGQSAFLINVVDLEWRKSEEKKLSQFQNTRSIVRMALGLTRYFCMGLESFKDQSYQLQSDRSIANKETIQLLKRFDAVLEVGNSISQRLNCLTKSGSYESDAVLFYPKDVIRDALSVIHPQWRENGRGRINVNTFLRTMSPIEGHPEEMRDALVILLLNAIDAMPDGGEIYVTTEENVGFAWIYIQDNGVGIPDDIRKIIFEPFFTTKGSTCMGLGLSLADAIVGRHGGEIEVLSQEGHGSTFIIKIPLSDKPIPSADKRVKNYIKDSSILIVSGGNIATELLTQMLVAKGGKVSTAYSCSEGLKFFRKRKSDMVIIDVDTPGFESAGIVLKIREMNKDLPIVLLNAGKKGKGFYKSAELASDLLIKRPMEMSAVVSRISEMIENRRQH